MSGYIDKKNFLNFKIAGTESQWKQEECIECGAMTKYLGIEHKCPVCDLRFYVNKTDVIL